MHVCLQQSIVKDYKVMPREGIYSFIDCKLAVPWNIHNIRVIL